MRPPKSSPKHHTQTTPRPQIERVVRKQHVVQNELHTYGTNKHTVHTFHDGRFGYTHIEDMQHNHRTDTNVSIWTQDTSDMEVVVKTMPIHALAKQEVKCLRSCRGHAHIVNYISDSLSDDGSYMRLVMDKCEGQELFQFIVDHDPIDLNVVCNIARQLLDTVRFLHEDRQITHRDIKPENIMYNFKTGVIQLIDFGYACRCTGHLIYGDVGTPYYKAYEIVERMGYTSKVDEWSVGVVLFMLLYGSAPFNGYTDEEIYFAIRNGVPQYPACIRSHDAKRCVDALLCTDPNRRATARQMLQYPWLKPH